MKRFITILLLVCLIPASAAAQWYLFPGSPQKKERERKQQQELARQELLSRRKPAADTTSVTPSATEEASVPVAEADSLETVPAVEPFVLDIPEVINVTLLLPIKASSKPNSNFLEYYSGALMAVKDLGSSGLAINLNVYDTEDASGRISDMTLAGSDVIVGPVSGNDILKTLARCPEGKRIVSPLEPKASGMADSLSIVQAPAPQETQIDELVKWLKEDMRYTDSLYVLRSPNETVPGSDTGYLLSRLEDSHLKYRVLETAYIRNMKSDGIMRFIVASNSEPFICSAVNAIGNLGANGQEVFLYSTSKIRSLEGINAESIFNANTRLTTNYFIDYGDKDVKDFVLAYRALFRNEPSSFAFHGYDTVRYFVSICAKYGRQWYRKLPEYEGKGLQTDFKFEDSDKVGDVNTAVRRVVYSPDLSATLK